MTLKEQNRLYNAAKKIAMTYRNRPGIVDIDFGIKRVNNAQTEDLAIRFKINKKVSLDLLNPKDVFPKMINGYLTDVIEVDSEFHGTWVKPSELTRPSVGGNQIVEKTWVETDFHGTLGCLFPLEGKVLGITNYHTLYGDLDSDTVSTDFVGKAKVYQNCSDKEVISIGLSHEAYDVDLDYATILLDKDLFSDAYTYEFKAFTSSITAMPISEIKLGETKVRKSGIGKTITYGIADGRSLLNPSVITIYEDINRPSVKGHISRLGDSGSVWIVDEPSDQIRVVALNSGSQEPHSAFGNSFDVIIKSIQEKSN